MFRRDFLSTIGATTASVIPTVTNAADIVVPGAAAGQRIQQAIDRVEKQGGGTIALKAGSYPLEQTLIVRGDRVRIVGESRATLLRANQAGQTMIRFSGSHGGVENMSLQGEAADVTALRIEPPADHDGKQTANQNYNRFSNLFIAGCRDAITLQAGPTVAGQGDSGCWYNVLETILIIYCQRGIWLKSPVKDRGSSVNRNQFYSVRIGQFVNTGIQIDAGDTNSFIGCSFEGIGHGNKPNATPTAILIHKSATTGADNNNNTFVANRFEGNQLDLDNRNSYSEFYGSNLAFGQNKVRGVEPLYVVGGYDPSYTPLIMPGLKVTGDSVRFTKEVHFDKPVHFAN